MSPEGLYPPQLVSLVAYHICPEAPFTADQLHAQQDVFTALNDTALLVGGRPSAAAGPAFAGRHAA